jgi:hypothetical protein
VDVAVTALQGCLACIRTHATTIPACPADNKGSLCMSDAIRWVRPVSDSHVASALHPRRSQLSLRGRCSGPDTLTNLVG